MSDTSQTKSEAASHRKREQAREKGQVASSNDFASGMILVLLILLLSHASFALGSELHVLMGQDLSAAVLQKELTMEQSVTIGRASSTFLLRSVMVVLVGGMLSAISAHIAQIGFQITPQSLAIKPSRLSPASGVKKIFSAKGAFRTGMAMTKFTVCTVAIAISCYIKRDVLMMSSTSVAQGVAQTWEMCLHLSMMGALSLIVVGAVDLVFQRWQHENDLKMTKQEVRDETKENEGDGQIKGKIRKLQSEAINQRSLKDVPNATVVITNPTHYAIAIRYDRDNMAAPLVVAKGKDLLAQRIKRLAAESGVPQFERRDVARALYASTEVGGGDPGIALSRCCRNSGLCLWAEEIGDQSTAFRDDVDSRILHVHSAAFLSLSGRRGTAAQIIAIGVVGSSDIISISDLIESLPQTELSNETNVDAPIRCRSTYNRNVISMCGRDDRNGLDRPSNAICGWKFGRGPYHCRNLDWLRV